MTLLLLHYNIFVCKYIQMEKKIKNWLEVESDFAHFTIAYNQNDFPINLLDKKGQLKYSDEVLVDFKKRIEARLKSATADLLLMKAALLRRINDEEATFILSDNSPHIFTWHEMAFLTIWQKHLIKELKNALKKTQDKTFGICAVTTSLIPLLSLKRNPCIVDVFDCVQETFCLN
jgi:DnaK suppressor protein